MKTLTKLAGVWKEVRRIYTKKRTSWREVRHVYAKANGKWELVFSRPSIMLRAHGLLQNVEQQAIRGVWFNGNQHQTGVAGRSWTLGLIDANGFVTFQETYDVHSNAVVDAGTIAAQNLAAKLNSLENDQLFFLITYDEPATNRMLGNLPQAMYRVGVSQSIFEKIAFRGAYLFLGRVNHRLYYENYIGNPNPEQDTDGDPRAALNVSFYVEKGQPLIYDYSPVAAFLGEVAAADFITGDALAAQVGLTAGTSFSSNSPWLSFTRHGKKLFIPKLPLRQTTNWLDLYNAGLVFGDDTIGVRPSSVATGVLQNKRVTIAGKTYIVRLLKGSAGGKTYVTPAAQNGNDLPLGYDSEWNDLYYLITNDPLITNYHGPKIANPYTPTDLGFTPNPSSGPRIRPCQEINADLAGTMLSRGNTNSSARLASDRLYNTTSTASAWTPCLELVE